MRKTKKKNFKERTNTDIINKKTTSVKELFIIKWKKLNCHLGDILVYLPEEQIVLCKGDC